MHKISGHCSNFGTASKELRPVDLPTMVDYSSASHLAWDVLNYQGGGQRIAYQCIKVWGTKYKLQVTVLLTTCTNILNNPTSSMNVHINSWIGKISSAHYPVQVVRAA
ncbi:hypothetical protein ABZP36_007083 [Zizania latifolia]